MERLETSDDLVRRRKLTAAEVKLAELASQLIKEYRLAAKLKGGIYSRITADQLVSAKVKDSSRQILILDLACLLESEARRSGKAMDDSTATPLMTDINPRPELLRGIEPGRAG